jgi:hypothetical protein
VIIQIEEIIVPHRKIGFSSLNDNVVKIKNDIESNINAMSKAALKGSSPGKNAISSQYAVKLNTIRMVWATAKKIIICLFTIY